MRETAIVLAMAVLLALLAFMGRMPFDWALVLGGRLVAVGLIIGLPAGVLYHVILYRELARSGGAPRGWIWRPTELHSRVPEARRRRFLPSCWVGAIACGVIFFGCAVVFIAVLGETLVGSG